MDPFQQLLAKQRPDVIQAGVPIDAWWQQNGAPELRAQLAALGRQDVLNVAGNDNNWLMQWYLQNGSYEYPNIWQPQGGAPQTAAPQQSIASQYAQGAADQAPTIPSWQAELPWESLKSQFQPQFEGSAQQFVAPEVNRQYKQSARDYMNNMASVGGGRFGRGWGGVGSLGATAQRSLKEQMLDYVNQYNSALGEWYGKTGEEWGKAATAGNVYDYNVPSYAEFTGATQLPSEATTSPVASPVATPVAKTTDRSLAPQYAKGSRDWLNPVTF